MCGGLYTCISMAVPVCSVISAVSSTSTEDKHAISGRHLQAGSPFVMEMTHWVKLR